MFWLHLGDQATAGVGCFAAKQHLRPHDQVTIEQPAQADQHDGAVCSDVADFVGGPGLGRHHPARTRALGRIPLLQFHLPAATGQRAANASRCGLGRFRQRTFGLVVKGPKALLADILFVDLQIHQNFGRVARDAQRRADHQKGQDQQEPPCAVNRIELDGCKEFCPERAELVHIIHRRFMLLEHRANDRCDADHRQQRNGKAHGRQQLDACTQGLGARPDLNALGCVRHERGERKH